MLNFLIRRIIFMVPTLLGVTIVVLLLIQNRTGGSNVRCFLPMRAKEVRDQLFKELGLDQPLPIQYLTWLRQLFQGNLGRSLAKSYSVNELLFQAVINSLILALAAAAFAFVTSFIVGNASVESISRFAKRFFILQQQKHLRLYYSQYFSGLLAATEMLLEKE